VTLPPSGRPVVRRRGANGAVKPPVARAGQDRLATEAVQFLRATRNDRHKRLLLGADLIVHQASGPRALAATSGSTGYQALLLRKNFKIAALALSPLRKADPDESEPIDSRFVHVFKNSRKRNAGVADIDMSRRDAKRSEQRSGLTGFQGRRR
jgi:hypothetical protein